MIAHSEKTQIYELGGKKYTVNVMQEFGKINIFLSENDGSGAAPVIPPKETRAPSRIELVMFEAWNITNKISSRFQKLERELRNYR